MEETTHTTTSVPTGDEALLAIALGRAAGLRAMPPGFILPSLTPGYIPHSRGPEAFIVFVVSMSVAFATVMGRLLTRRIVSGGLGLDDWMVMIGTMFAILLTADGCFAVAEGGLGKHGWDLTYSEVATGLKTMYAFMPLYTLAISFAKLSIICFVRRLVGPRDRVNLYIIRAYIAFHVMFACGCLVMYLVQCTPIPAMGSIDLRFQPGTVCRDYLVGYWLTAGIQMAADFATLALPISMIWSLQLLPQGKKITVALLFGLGGLACVCSAMRMAYIGKFATSSELSWDAFWPAIWGHLEISITLTTTSFPALKPAWTKYSPRVSQYVTQKTRGSRSREESGEVAIVMVVHPDKMPADSNRKQELHHSESTEAILMYAMA